MGNSSPQGEKAPPFSLTPERLAAARSRVARQFPAPGLVNQLAVTLMAAWEAAEHEPVTASRVATFADMARAALDYHRPDVGNAAPDVAPTDREGFCWELGPSLVDAMEQLGIDDDLSPSDGRALADTVYCLGYRKPSSPSPGAAKDDGS